MCPLLFVNSLKASPEPDTFSCSVEPEEGEGKKQQKAIVVQSLMRHERNSLRNFHLSSHPSIPISTF